MGDNFEAFHAGKIPAAIASETDNNQTLTRSCGRKIGGNELILKLGPLLDEENPVMAYPAATPMAKPSVAPITPIIAASTKKRARMVEF